MLDPTYENITPLIAEETQQGSKVIVIFRCETSGISANAEAPITKIKSAKSTAERSVKRNLWYALRRAVTSAIHSAVGSGMAGRVARDVANTSIQGATSKASHTKDEVRAAVVVAFAKVITSFKWDGDAWVGSAGADTPFGKLLQDAPVTEKYDQGMLARALVEIVCADGQVTEEEEAFVGDVVDPELGTIEELAKRDKLSDAELSEVTAGVRDTLLMLAWAGAMCDEDLADEEAARLSEIGAGLGIADDRLVELRGYAQQFLLEQALLEAYPGGGARDDAAFAAAMNAAAKLGVSESDAEKIDVGYRKRNGIV